jgi:hypothetical protein
MNNKNSIDNKDKMKTANRLRQALVSMLEGDGKLTALELCVRADISRNALYRYHPDVLQELHLLQKLRCREPSISKAKFEKLSTENEILRSQISKLAALVDHYFGAWQESSNLLKRRDKELSDLRRDIKSKVVLLKN